MPHHVRPLRFLLPVYRDARVGRLKFKLGLWLYDRLAGPDQPVGPHRGLSAAALGHEEPSLILDRCTGGFDYGDCGTDDARMVLEIVETAQVAGAAVVNYVRAESLLEEKGRVVGAVVQDLEEGVRREIRASATVLAAGAWSERLAGVPLSSPLARYTKGVHLVMPPLRGGHALLLTAPRDGRVFFLIPWYGRTLLGTTDTDFETNPDALRVESADVDYLLEAAAAYLRPAWTRKDILGAFCGLRTLRREEGKTASEITREWSLERPRPGLWMPVGGKYTSARVEAGDVVQSVLTALGRTSAQPVPDPRPMAWYPESPFNEWSADRISKGIAAGLDAEMARCAVARHGRRFDGLLARLRTDPTLSRRLVQHAPFCRAEVPMAVEEEMARTLIDVLRRRMPLLILGEMPRAAVEDAAALAAPLLGWDVQRCRLEVASVLEAKQEQLPFIPSGT
jgi:glycerol-3-phosphate dehydrogenase